MNYLNLLPVIGFSFLAQSIVHSQIIIDDSFDDDDIGTNANGEGGGFNLLVTSEGSNLEADGAAIFIGGSAGAARVQIGSRDSFDASLVDGVTGTFVLSDFIRSASVNSNTSRVFVGFVAGNGTGNTGVVNASVLERQVDGLWVGLKTREDTGGVDNGMGGLFYVDGATVTELSSWTWDQSLVSWDDFSAFRSDRIAQDLVDDLTLTLTSNEVGYSLTFGTSGDGVLPANISGTWADSGVINDLDVAHAAVHFQGEEGPDADLPNGCTLESIQVVTGLVEPVPTSIEIQEFTYLPESDSVILTWDSVSGQIYTIQFSTDLMIWEGDLRDGVPASAVGNTTTGTFDLVNPGLQDLSKLFFRVLLEE